MRKKTTPQQAFFDRWAKTYDNTIRKYEYGAPPLIFEEVWSRLSGRPEQVLRLLDLGIGTGVTSKPFAQTGRFHISGTDISEKMLDVCRASGAADEIVQINLERDDLPFADGSFDAVISGGVFEFIADPEELIRETARVLKRGGIVAATYETPFTKDLYPPGFLQGILEDGPDRVTVQRFVVQDFRPQLYRKYLFSTEIIRLMFEGYGVGTLKNESFTAYRWPGGRDVLYNMYVGKRL